ncbi:MAG: hypothetical protein OXC46_05395 [Thaumarchaeota archaeon]|nr:hypothetical protein [Nitrososphaerota archaeon]
MGFTAAHASHGDDIQFAYYDSGNIYAQYNVVDGRWIMEILYHDDEDNTLCCYFHEGEIITKEKWDLIHSPDKTESPEDLESVIELIDMLTEMIAELTKRVDMLEHQEQTPEPTEIIYYDVDPYPTYTDTSSQITQESLRKAISSWETNNPELDFVKTDLEFETIRYSDGTSDFPVAPTNHNGLTFSVQWEKYTNETTGHLGLAFCDSDERISPTSCVLTIFMGNDDCNNRYVTYDEPAVRDTVEHEIGHALGLEHHVFNSHLMYGAFDEFSEIPFDDLGYNIPQKESVGNYYEGQNDIASKFSEYDSALSELDDKIEDEEDQAKRASLTDLYNKIVGEYNTQIKQFRCYPNVVSETSANEALNPTTKEYIGYYDDDTITPSQGN